MRRDTRGGFFVFASIKCVFWRLKCYKSKENAKKIKKVQKYLHISKNCSTFAPSFKKDTTTTTL